VQLVIYRQSDGSFSEVARGEMVTPVVGYNKFTLSKKIKVLAGDFVGFYAAGQGPISWNADRRLQLF